MAKHTSIKLSDGNSIPRIGLGVSGLAEGEQTRNSIRWALEAGYRHIDTAKLYGNEASVGDAIRGSKVQRSRIFVTTKLWPTDFVNPKKAIEKSMAKLGIDYIDLYLIHWPTPIELPGFDKRLWRQMESFKEQGLTRSIGVSNYPAKRLGAILSVANDPPVVNQIQCNPFHYSKSLHEYCADSDIVVVGYYPLAEAKLFGNPIIMQIAKKHSKSSAQIMLRWAIQNNVIPIPKSSSKERIEENISVFDFKLSEQDMASLDALSK